jgi:hypothetical protein
MIIKQLRSYMLSIMSSLRSSVKNSEIFIAKRTGDFMILFCIDAEHIRLLARSHNIDPNLT